MSFKVGGTDINELIVEETSNLQTSFDGINISTSSTNSYSSTKPNTLHYSIGGTDLSEYATATYSEYNTSGNVTIPSWCKSIRMYCVGGLGGSGGQGGKADADSYTGPADRGRDGGAGGAGGNGFIVALSNPAGVSSSSSVYVTIGSKGSDGDKGQDKHTKGPSSSGRGQNTTKAGAGGNGSQGGETYISIDGYKYCTAFGGLGGVGGEGGKASAYWSAGGNQNDYGDDGASAANGNETGTSNFHVNARPFANNSYARIYFLRDD